MNFEICKKCIGEDVTLLARGDFTSCGDFFDVYVISFVLKEKYHRKCMQIIRPTVKFSVSDFCQIVDDKNEFLNYNKAMKRCFIEFNIKSGFEYAICDKTYIETCSYSRSRYYSQCPYSFEIELCDWNFNL